LSVSRLLYALGVHVEAHEVVLARKKKERKNQRHLDVDMEG
jgi:hypothetical protein